MELEDAYAGLLYVYEHADALHVDKENIILEGDCFDLMDKTMSGK